jgi:hypothetical protein
MKRDADSGKPELRIVDQNRRAKARQYELACGDGRLTVNVEGEREDEGPWRVEVRGKRRGGETVSASESGESRLDAFRASSRAWQTAASPHGLDIFDFERVEQLLDGVRAL